MNFESSNGRGLTLASADWELQRSSWPKWMSHFWKGVLLQVHIDFSGHASMTDVASGQTWQHLSWHDTDRLQLNKVQHRWWCLHRNPRPGRLPGYRWSGRSANAQARVLSVHTSYSMQNLSDIGPHLKGFCAAFIDVLLFSGIDIAWPLGDVCCNENEGKPCISPMQAMSKMLLENLQLHIEGSLLINFTYLQGALCSLIQNWQ